MDSGSDDPESDNKSGYQRLGWKGFHANSFKEAVQQITSYLEDTREPNQVIYFDGWDGLGASSFLTSVAENPPPSLKSRYDSIIHIDCSRWENRRALQRTIAEKLRFPQHVMDIFGRQDEDDDFGGVAQDSRLEIRDVGRQIHQALQGQSCLVIFHNGGNTMVDFNNLGIPRAAADEWSNVVSKVLWTFRGRLRVIPGLEQRAQGVDSSHISLFANFYDTVSMSTAKKTVHWDTMLPLEAREINEYMNKDGITPGIAEACCGYLLFLESNGVDTLDYNWATHAANYWVCDGIIQECQQDKAWELATALHEEMRLDNFSSSRWPYFSANRLPTIEDFFFCGDLLRIIQDYRTRWIVATNSGSEEIVPTENPKATSYFLANERGHNHPTASLPNNMFQRSLQLRVLKLCGCIFSFSSPPFGHCHNLRFLGLDNCKNQPHVPDEYKEEEKEKGKDRPTMEFFQSLWVLDICCTDWELTLPPNIMEQMATNIREINIKRGRIWHNDPAWTWRHLHNIHKLRLIEPTCPWETGSMNEFIGMVKLEFLDLSGNSTIRVLPGLSGATVLRTLVLDGCTRVEHVTPESLPPLLETFSFVAGAGKDCDKEAKISCISMAGCARLVNFRLGGLLPKLELLDLSNTSVKSVDLEDEVVQVPRLQRVILLGCERLRSVLWPEKGVPKLMVLCIDTRGVGGGEAFMKTTHDYLSSQEQEQYCCARVAIMDMRFLQSLVLRIGNEFCWNTDRFNLNLCMSCSSKDDGQNYNKDKIGLYSTKQFDESPPHKSSMLKTHCNYTDVNFDKATSDDQEGSSSWQFQPLDLHVDIGEGICNTNVVTAQAIMAVKFLMSRVKSLVVHDNSSLSIVVPERMIPLVWGWKRDTINWPCLKWCRVERCLKLDTVFILDDNISSFSELETFWAAELLMARCIWSFRIGIAYSLSDKTFEKLRVIHLQFCPRLTSVLVLSWKTLPSLERLHIVCCGDLSQVFPLNKYFLRDICSRKRGVLQFPKLKHIYLHELPKLHQICEAKMFAPELKTIWVRGCWSLKRLPATDNVPHGRPVVDCEKDWWDKLEWDGKESLHHPSLFEPRHSKYYKKTLLRGSVLR